MAYGDPTPKQINFIKELRDERQLSAVALERLNTRLLATEAGDYDKLTFDDASKVIKWLLEQPKQEGTVQAERTPLPDVPEGRYALVEDGAVKFFQVDRPTLGKWKGYTFLKAQASDDTHPVKDAARKLAVLTAIASNVEGALKLYGTQIGRCGHCGRSLTSDWRKVGVGPICAQKAGYASEPYVDEVGDIPADAPRLPDTGMRTDAQIRQERTQALERLSQVAAPAKPAKAKPQPQNFQDLLALRKPR